MLSNRYGHKKSGEVCQIKLEMKPYYETELGKLYHGDCLEIMPHIEPVDLVVTSPPYDNLRDYGGHTFDFKKVARFVCLKIKHGGVVVWVVGDATVDGSETGTSFKQALYFKEIGFKLHDTMVYHKESPPLTHNRYEQHFEYMFVFSCGFPKTFNPILMRKLYHDKRKKKGVRREKDGSTDIGFSSPKTTKIKGNVWKYKVGGGHVTKDKIAYQHPAIFPEQLAADHIISWSNEGDTVADIMCGSGTTLKMAEKLNRRWIGIEIEEKYCEIAAQRIENERKQIKLFT
jgi:site-specific DNA-methyltransferase (adenine-specific)